MAWGFTFLCSHAELIYDSQRTAFYQTHESTDDYIETKEGFELLHVNTPDYLLAVACPHKRPWYLSPWVYFLTTLMLLSWPMRILIQYKIAYVHCHVQKAFGHLLMNAAAGGVQATVGTAAGADYVGGSLASLNSDLARQDRFQELDSGGGYIEGTNLLQLPSYSEAVLLPPPEDNDCNPFRYPPHRNFFREQQQHHQHQSQSAHPPQSASTATISSASAAAAITSALAFYAEDNVENNNIIEEAEQSALPSYADALRLLRRLPSSLSHSRLAQAVIARSRSWFRNRPAERQQHQQQSERLHWQGSAGSSRRTSQQSNFINLSNRRNQSHRQLQQQELRQQQQQQQIVGNGFQRGCSGMPRSVSDYHQYRRRQAGGVGCLRQQPSSPMLAILLNDGSVASRTAIAAVEEVATIEDPEAREDASHACYV